MTDNHGTPLLQRLLLSCKQVNHTLTSDTAQSWQTRLQLRCHLLLCSSCRKFAAHLAMISKKFRELCAQDQVSIEEVEKLKAQAMRELDQKREK